MLNSLYKNTQRDIFAANTKHPAVFGFMLAAVEVVITLLLCSMFTTSVLNPMGVESAIVRYLTTFIVANVITVIYSHVADFIFGGINKFAENHIFSKAKVAA